MESDTSLYGSMQRILNWFLNLPGIDQDIPIALNYARLAQELLQDQQLLQEQMGHPLQFLTQHFQGIEFISHQPSPIEPWTICIPTTQRLIKVVNCYHQILTHCGILCIT
jgi:hypothetical protein